MEGLGGEQISGACYENPENSIKNMLNILKKVKNKLLLNYLCML